MFLGRKSGKPAGVLRCTGKTTLSFLVVSLLMLYATAAFSDVTVTATLEPQAVSVGEQATLTVTVKGKFRKSGGAELPSLEDIDIYEAGSSQNFSFVNGAMSASVSFTYILVPRKEGTYKIAPIRFTVGNKIYTANPLTLEAVKGRAYVQQPQPQTPTGRVDDSVKGKNLFILADVDKDTVYVNQQITWRLGYYTDGRVQLVQSPNYSPPEAEGFWVEDLPPLNKYYTNIDNRQYLVNEIKRGYFPTAPGDYIIGGANVEIVIHDRDPFSTDDFFSRSFRSFGFGKSKTLTTNPVNITVLPLPASGRPRDFSGIVARGISLDLQASKQVVQVGEPVNITLEIEGQGNIKTIAAPKLPGVEGFKIYESGSSSEVYKKNYVVSGKKAYEYVFVPKVEGKKIIPPLSLSYFDPIEERYKTAESGSIHLTVNPGMQEEGRRIVFAGGEDQIEVLARDVKYIHPVPLSLAVNPSRIYENNVYAALHLVPLLAIFASLAVERRNRRWRDNIQVARSERAAREALKKLHKTESFLKRGDMEQTFSLISESIWGYTADKMGVPPAGLTIESVESFLASKGVGEEEVSNLRRVLKTCDAVKYSTESVGENQAKETVKNAVLIIKSLEKRYLK